MKRSRSAQSDESNPRNFDAVEFTELDESKYYLFDQSREQLISTRELTEAEFLKLKEASKVLHELQYFNRTEAGVLMNLLDLEKAFDHYTQKFEKKFEQQTELEIPLVDMNRLLQNFLASFQAMVDQMEDKLTARYGKSSEPFSNFKSYLSNLYDGYFSYRFFYKLRNFSIHSYEFPLNGFGIETEPGKTAFNAYFDRDQLLQNKQMKKLRSDLLRFGHEFPLMPI